jgi:hypothetical protein
MVTCTDFNTNPRISLAAFKGPSKSLAPATTEVNWVTKMAPSNTRWAVERSPVVELAEGP